MDIVAQLLHSINAARPTEQALQNDNRRLNDEVVALQAQLHQQTIRADAATTRAEAAIKTNSGGFPD